MKDHNSSALNFDVTSRSILGRHRNCSLNISESKGHQPFVTVENPSNINESEGHQSIISVRNRFKPRQHVPIRRWHGISSTWERRSWRYGRLSYEGRSWYGRSSVRWRRREGRRRRPHVSICANLRCPLPGARLTLLHFRNLPRGSPGTQRRWQRSGNGRCPIWRRWSNGWCTGWHAAQPSLRRIRI
jgi:hypothetical protein